jgi:hypothetical protein
MTAQIVAIVALCISWIWWVTLVIGASAMLVLQVAWCCKITKCGLTAAAILSSLTALLCFFAGVWTIVKWKNVTWCHVFVVIQDDDYDYYDDDFFYPDDDSRDFCPEVAWAVVAFVDCALWALAAYCIFYFVTSGRYDQAAACLVEQEQEVEEGVAVEIATVIAIPAPNAPALLSPTATAIYLPQDQEIKFANKSLSQDHENQV